MKRSMDMSDLRFRRDYWDDDAAREAFIDFLRSVHGLDLTRWKNAGYWDFDHYHPFSFFNESSQVVASTNLFTLDLVIDGKTCRGAQFSGVGTRPELRRRGLNRILTQRAIEWARSRHELLFLFASDEALPFYESSGFRPLDEQEPFVRVEGRFTEPGIQRLDLSRQSDRRLVETFAFRRCPVSAVLAAHNPKLFLFHVLYEFTEDVYLIPELDLLVLLKRDGSRLTLADVLGERMPTFEELLPFVVTEETEDIRFGFVPDLLEPKDLQWRPLVGNNGHDRGELTLRGQRFLFPKTSHA